MKTLKGRRKVLINKYIKKRHKPVRIIVCRRINPYDFLPGGYADNMPNHIFNRSQLRKGTRIEMEHTNNPRIAREIAKDHLMEIPNYYTHLTRMERRAKRRMHDPLMKKLEKIQPSKLQKKYEALSTEDILKELESINTRKRRSMYLIDRKPLKKWTTKEAAKEMARIQESVDNIKKLGVEKKKNYGSAWLLSDKAQIVSKMNVPKYFKSTVGGRQLITNEVYPDFLDTVRFNKGMDKQFYRAN